MQCPEVVLETATVYASCQPLIDRSVELVQRLFGRLLEHGIDPENSRELGAIYLVGGGSAFVPVGRTLRTLYKKKIQSAPQPHAATAIGLSIAADPDSLTFVRETVTRHFGVWREAEAGREKVFDLIFTKNETPDGDAASVVERRYRPEHPIGHLRYLECSDLDPSGQPGGDLAPWGEVFFPYDPALATCSELQRHPFERRPELASEEIIEMYRYLSDGTVEVEIRNATANYRKRYVLGNPLREGA
jgi:hypothetical protein